MPAVIELKNVQKLSTLLQKSLNRLLKKSLFGKEKLTIGRTAVI